MEYLSLPSTAVLLTVVLGALCGALCVAAGVYLSIFESGGSTSGGDTDREFSGTLFDKVKISIKNYGNSVVLIALGFILLMLAGWQGNSAVDDRLDEVETSLSQVEERLQVVRDSLRRHATRYSVRGLVRKQGADYHGDVNIWKRFPPAHTDGEGRLVQVEVSREANGRLPTLHFDHPAYRPDRIDLSDERQVEVKGNNVILRDTVVLRPLPSESLGEQ